MYRTEVTQEERTALANYINNIREHRRLGHNQLSVLAKIDASALHKILHGTVKKVNPFHLQAIAKALRIDYNILYKIVGYLERSSEDKLVSLELEEDIPVYSKVHVGVSGNLEYGEILEYITIPRLGNGSEIIGIKVDGNSMDRTIPDGATILVKKDVELLNNEIGVFVYQNNPIVKKIQEKDGVTILLSDNCSYDPIIILDREEYSVVGKVVEVMYKL